MDNLTQSFFFLIQEELERIQGEDRDWTLETPSDSSNIWIYLRNSSSRTPPQGWKLHVSASVLSAEDVLRRTLPLLLADNADFKVAASTSVLSTLNQGDFGLSQIGKFITIYPCNEDQFIRLATALHEATREFDGPPIPSDRTFAQRSLVHYRYGGFDQQLIQLPIGEITPAITTPWGEQIPDRRMPIYYAPDWVSDPFFSNSEKPRRPLQVGKRYLLVSTIHQSARGRFTWQLILSIAVAAS